MTHRLGIACLLVVVLAAPARAGGDATAGEKVFQKCRACHQVGEAARNAVGPNLNGVVGRPAASLAGYAYSPAYKAVAAGSGGGVVMDEANITKWLASPKTFAPGNKMAFAGLASQADIADVVAFLEQFGTDGKRK